MRFSLLLATLLLLALAGRTQTADLSYGHAAYRYLDRVDILGLADTSYANATQPVQRWHASRLLRGASTSGLGPKSLAWHKRTLQLVVDPQLETSGLWNTFYTNRRDLIQVNTPGFTLYLNPVLDLRYGAEQVDGGDTRTLFTNARGLQARGSLLGKVGYFFELIETQSRQPQFVHNRIEQYDAVPGQGFFKPFKEDAYDYLNARGYITYRPANWFALKFGRDRNFWGYGSQSLALSDYGVDYLFLQFTTRIWKLEYTNLFSEFIDYIPNKPDAAGTQPRKYGAFHMLTYRPNHKLAFSVFESTIFAPTLANGRRGFELQYLNPIIFYRTVEQYVGSPDNSVLGLMWKANIWQRVQFYGQFILDDFNVAQSQNGSGWWGNKWGAQAGLKYINAFGIETLDAQLEANLIRPFTYTHFNISTTYSHYGQFLAHSRGTNLVDLNLTLTYQPIPALELYLRYNRVDQGLNPTTGENLGGEVLNAAPPESDFGNTIGQGDALQLDYLVGRASYQFYFWTPHLWLDLEAFYRSENEVSSLGGSLGLRYNMPWRPYTY